LRSASIHKDLAYVTDGHERQKLDLYIPEGEGPFPVLVWIHGGAWRAGSKKNARGLESLDRGVAVASLNYRLSQHAIFPAQIEDCKSAIRWLRAHADKYQLDTDRLVVRGASAGGHLVALLGVTGNVRTFDEGENLDQSSSVTAAIDEFGPTDFLQMDAMDGEIGKMDHNAKDSPESQLIGGPIQEHPDKVKLANPLTYVSEGDAPFLIIHGDQDPLVAHGQSVILHDALKSAGVPSVLYTVQGGKHGWFKDPQVGQRIAKFLVKYLDLSH
jgi:acetyl esterase/lipase